MGAQLILRNFFTGETSGGNFTLTNLTQYPNTIFVTGGIGNVTFNSAADLPYTVPLGYLTVVTVTTPGVYTFDYCVDSCPSVACSTVDITIIEKPIIGTTPTIYRCGVNGVYNNINVCYSGALTNTSDGLPYSGTLSSFTWSKGAWSATGNCVTIPTSVSAGTITLTATTTGGTCVSTNTVTLTDVNIYAGDTNTKTVCFDRLVWDAVKDLPGAINFQHELDTLFNPVGSSVPSGTLETWSQLSGPSTIQFLTNKKVLFGDILPGTYTFKRKLTYGSCTSETTFTLIIKYCTRGTYNYPIEKACALNQTYVMNTTYAALIPSNMNPITGGGCWLYVGNIFGGTGTLDIEINGTTYLNFQAGCTFPYNSTIKILSAGKFDFEYTWENQCPAWCTSGPCGCILYDDKIECGCPDGFIGSYTAGLFRVNTLTTVPNTGSSKIIALGCDSRQIKLYTKFNQLNGGGVTAGGVWTYQGVTAPITFLVDGVSMAFNIGDTIPGSDPLVDLTGLPNPSNYAFKYTVTNSCGTANKTLFVNITCNDCNKTIGTTVSTVPCDYTVSFYHPITNTQNVGLLSIPTNSSNAILSFVAKIKDCTNTIVYTKLIEGVYDYAWFTQHTAFSLVNGGYFKSIKLYSSTLGLKTLNLDPTTTPYLTGCAGTVSPASLYFNYLDKNTFTNAIKTLLRNAICTEFGGAVILTNYNLFFGWIGNALYISFMAKHLPSSQWIGYDINNSTLVYQNGSTLRTINYSTFNHKPNVSPVIYTEEFSQYCGTFSYYIGEVDRDVYGIDLPSSSLTNITLLQSSYPLTPNPLTDKLVNTCKNWNFSTTISPACTGTPTYSYKVGGVSIPDNTATFTRKTNSTECNPFNSGLSQSLETTVVCDGCTYVKTPITFC